MQDVVRISSSVQVDSVSRITGDVMETTTVETCPMNRTVEVPPPHHQVLLYNHLNTAPKFATTPACMCMHIKIISSQLPVIDTLLCIEC